MLSHALPTGFAGGRYRVKAFLGEGGSKRVYLTHDTRLERDVAVAVMRTEGLDEARLARVRREAQAMARLGGETGDLIDAQLRHGNAHTAEGGVEFIGALLDAVERQLCQVAACARMPAFPRRACSERSRSGARPTWPGCATTRCSIGWPSPTSGARSGGRRWSR